MASGISSQPKLRVWPVQVKGIWNELLHFQDINTSILHFPETELFCSQVGIIFFSKISDFPSAAFEFMLIIDLCSHTT